MTNEEALAMINTKNIRLGHTAEDDWLCFRLPTGGDIALIFTDLIRFYCNLISAKDMNGTSNPIIR